MLNSVSQALISMSGRSIFSTPESIRCLVSSVSSSMPFFPLIIRKRALSAFSAFTFSFCCFGAVLICSERLSSIACSLSSSAMRRLSSYDPPLRNACSSIASRSVPTVMSFAFIAKLSVPFVIRHEYDAVSSFTVLLSFAEASSSSSPEISMPFTLVPSGNVFTGTAVTTGEGLSLGAGSGVGVIMLLPSGSLPQAVMLTSIDRIHTVIIITFRFFAFIWVSLFSFNRKYDRINV